MVKSAEEKLKELQDERKKYYRQDINQPSKRLKTERRGMVYRKKYIVPKQPLTFQRRPTIYTNKTHEEMVNEILSL